MKYKTRPVQIEVEAMQLQVDNVYEMMTFLGGDFKRTEPIGPVIEFWCAKSEKILPLRVGDWAIKEMDGIGFYPCVNSAFIAKYELP